MRGVEVRADVLGGELVFRGTRLSVRHIAELARRVGTAVVLKDYPDLTTEDVEYALQVPPP